LTATPEDIPTPTVVPTQPPEPTPPETPLPTPNPDDDDEKELKVHAHLGDLLLATFGTLIIGGAGYYILRFNNQPVEHALRITLWSVIGGLGLYVSYALLLPMAKWLQQGGSWGVGWSALLGSSVPLIIAWLIIRRRASG
jgi:hypothetical protein